MTEALEPSEEIGCAYMNTHTHILFLAVDMRTGTHF